ncbi:GT2 family glycosyltransferase [Gelidibacter sediminis]|uniref:GT2 family glycosyltransferase n=1 Tax=Gelidibacter sediminis TaxID=1608710 RepID=A0A4R7PWV7_9FLAO|nr:glycosyltransferase family 2 protein [Gelidibacter sediminis]TDU39398.1 GT2 family glycosyltransferase [Gelidibacter sediminis]
MKLSVVILNYNVRYFLELCLKSVEVAITDLDAEIIVVDNNSSDNSCVMVQQLFPRVKLIQNSQNLGFSKANNLGVAQAKGQYICILNPDTVVAEDTFINCLNYAKNQSYLGIIGCQLIDGRGKFLPESKRHVPTPLVALKKIIGFSNSYYANHLSASEIGKVDVLVGAFMLLKKEVYDAVGGFDEAYFMYGEDIDLSYKVLKAGYCNYYYGESSIIHFKGESTLKNRLYAKRFYGAMQIFYNKHFKSHALLNAIVWLGIKLSIRNRKSPKAVRFQVGEHIIVSKNAVFNMPMPFKYTVVNQLNDAATHSQIIFDESTLSYKDIISAMSTSDQKKSFTFRILSSSAQFIIGSDSSQQRGDVLQLN